MNTNLEEMVEAVAGTENLYEAGRRMKEFTDEIEGYGDEELEEALSLFWTVLLEYSADDLNFQSPDNHGYLICPPEKLIATDLCNRIPFYTEAKENLAAIKETADELLEFGKKSGYQLNPEIVQLVMDDFEDRFGIISRLTAKHRMIVFLHTAGPTDVGGGLLFHYYSDIDTTIAHITFYPSSMRDFLVSVMGVGEEIAQPLAKALCFAAFHTDHRSYRHVSIPEDMYPLLSDCGCDIEDTEGMVANMENALRKALMLDSPYGGVLTAKQKADMGEEKAEAHRQLLQAALDRVGIEK